MYKKYDYRPDFGLNPPCLAIGFHIPPPIAIAGTNLLYGRQRLDIPVTIYRLNQFLMEWLDANTAISGDCH